MSKKGNHGQQGKPEAGRTATTGAAQAGPEDHTAVALTVTVLEDLHAGSGLGSASVDALLARDRQGRPVIRWSHLKGLLAESARERDRALGVDANQTKATLAQWFGHRDPAGQQRGSVRGLSLRLRNGSGAVTDTLVVSSTARQRLSRVPKEDTLRQVEYLRRGTVFSGELRVSSTPDSKLLNDLLARLRRVSRLGAHRSRGDGLVHLEFTARPLRRPPPVHCEPVADDAACSWATRRLLLLALEPLCLAATGQPGNLIPTRTHVGPGTVAGMFIGWLLANGWTSLADAALQGRLVFGAACPLPPGRANPEKIACVDVVPIPLDMRRPKPAGQASRWPWWAATAQDGVAPGEVEVEKLKRPDANEYLWTADGSVWQRWRCPTQVTLRSDAGRSRLENSRQQLFSVEEVPEDTDFVVTVQVRSDALAAFDAACKGLTEGRHWLHAGRGGAALQLVAHGEPQAQPPATASAGGQADQVRVFVETDLLLRTPELGFRVNLDLAAARDLLIEAGAPQDLLAALVAAEHVSEPTSVHGWNVATGAARLPAQAIRRGSVADLQFAGADRADQARALLSACAARGLGERTGEGQGRVRIGFRPQVIEPQPQPDVAPPNQLEVQMQEVQEWLSRPEMPAFTASRWQALREAAMRGTADVQDWFTRAVVEAQLLKQGERWVQALRDERQAQRGFLGHLALRAAKQVKPTRSGGPRGDAAQEDQA